MKIRSHQLRSAPQLTLRIAIVLVIVASLSILVDPVARNAPSAARSSPWSGLLAAWAEPAPALAQEAKPGMRAGARCAECGVIESSSNTETTNEVSDVNTQDRAAAISRGRTITVRLADGSRRVIGDPMSANWRVSERVVIIGGLTPDR